MRITIDLSDEQSAHLRKMAESLRIGLDELARAVLADWLAQPADDFRKAAEHVLQKNKDLYHKLA